MKTGECIVCGEEIAWTRGRKRFCDECLDAYHSVYSRFKRREAKGGGSGAEFEREVVEETRRELRKGKPGREAPPKHPCPYCGRMTRGKYCKACEFQGFAAIHEVTGKTNGWDAPVRRAAIPTDKQTADGWRGRKMAGGGKHKLWLSA